MKKCNACGETKQEDEFYWQIKSQGRRLSICIPCRKARRKAAWAAGIERENNYANKKKNFDRLRDHVWSILKDAQCLDCGIDNPVVLEFDHVRGEKFSDITRMISSNYSLDKIKEEIEKCEIVCANCHKIRTSTRGNHWRVVRLTST